MELTLKISFLVLPDKRFQIFSILHFQRKLVFEFLNVKSETEENENHLKVLWELRSRQNQI